MKRYNKAFFPSLFLLLIFLAFSCSFAGENQQYRFFHFFAEDAAVVPTQWWEGQLRFISDGQYRSINIPDSDTLVLSPIVAVALRDNIEMGAILSIEDIDYDRYFYSERSGSGLSDTDIYIKYRMKTDPVTLSFGALATLPTGDEDEGRGTGKVNVELFGSARKEVERFTAMAIFGFRFNRDATILGVVDLDAKTSVILGGGIIYPLNQTIAVTGEISVESERYKNADSDIRITPGIELKAFKNSLLRAGLGIGLSDGAPDFDAILSYVYTF